MTLTTLSLLLWIALVIAVIVMDGSEPLLVAALAALVVALVVVERRQI